MEVRRTPDQNDPRGTSQTLGAGGGGDDVMKACTRSGALRGRSALGVLKVWHRSFPFFLLFFLRSDETFSAARRVAAPTSLNATPPHFRRTQTVGSIHEITPPRPPHPVFFVRFCPPACTCVSVRALPPSIHLPVERSPRPAAAQ